VTNVFNELCPMVGWQFRLFNESGIKLVCSSNIHTLETNQIASSLNWQTV